MAGDSLGDNRAPMRTDTDAENVQKGIERVEKVYKLEKEMTEEKKTIWWRKSSTINKNVDMFSGKMRETETESEHAYYGGQFEGSKPEDRVHLGAVVWKPEEGKPNVYHVFVQKKFDDLDEAKEYVEKTGMAWLKRDLMEKKDAV